MNASFSSHHLLINRYEGPRNAEALAEYVNKEGGTFLVDTS